MDRQTVFGVSQVMMGALFVLWAVTEPSYFSLLMGVAGLCIAGMGIGVLTGRFETRISDSELSDLERRTALAALTVGALSLAGLVYLHVR